MTLIHTWNVIYVCFTGAHDDHNSVDDSNYSIYSHMSYAVGKLDFTKNHSIISSLYIHQLSPLCEVGVGLLCSERFWINNDSIIIGKSAHLIGLFDIAVILWKVHFFRLHLAFLNYIFGLDWCLMVYFNSPSYQDMPTMSRGIQNFNLMVEFFLGRWAISIASLIRHTSLSLLRKARCNNIHVSIRRS